MSRWGSLFVLILAGCGAPPATPADQPDLPSRPTHPDEPGPTPSDPTPTQPAPGGLDAAAQLSPEVQAYAAELKVSLEQARETTAEELATLYTPAFASTLGYDPSAAANMALIQSSKLQLDAAEQAVLQKHGFALSRRQQFPSFAYGYATIYAEDLPVFISADSVLDALHRSYDKMLEACEVGLIIADLTRLLTSLVHGARALPATSMQQDLVVYLEVADSLLFGAARSGISTQAAELVQLATAAEGTATVQLFGVLREEDMSQFKPRGHYADTPLMQQYFRAMMWLGRVDFRLVETQRDGTQVVHRPQIEAMFALESLLNAEDDTRFARMERILATFVGDSDNMTLAQVPALRSALGADLSALSDDQLKQVILSQGFGKQQIASHLMVGGLDKPNPLNASFLLFGQRYTVDSHVLSNVVWDRTRALRMMPDALDVAFAALGNGQAVSLLKDQLTQYQYAGDLHAMRTLIDSHEPAFWQKNLYTGWLQALRELSPDPQTFANSPSVVASEAWGRRILNTQLSSWAQLRHDTLLYTKPSYTSAAVCEFPDAAVDPYPELWAAIASYADKGNLLVSALLEPAPLLAREIETYLGALRDIAVNLQGIAEAQRDQRALSESQLAFINDAVVIKQESGGCVLTEIATGWYTRLFFRGDPLAFDPTIADIHTQPTDEGGNPVGRVLHVANGQPTLMVVTLDGCSAGPRAYVGLASSYHERVTESFTRLTDSQWAADVRANRNPAPPAWSVDL
jgi:hypothetical protein